METQHEARASEVRPLRRRSNDRMIAGVAGGIGDYTGLDPVIFRIGFIALALLGGAGIALYLVAWLLIPQATEEQSPAESALGSLRGLPAWVGVVLMAVAIAMIFGAMGFWEARIIWALGLMAVGFVLLREESRPAPSPESPPPPDPTAGPVPSDARVGPESAAIPDSGSGEIPTSALAAPPGAVPPDFAPPVAAEAKPPKERSSLGWFTVATVLIAIGVAAVLENWNVLELDVGQFFALALTVIGGGLLVGAWWGRARFMILLGVLLVPLVLGSSLIDMPLRGTVGERFLMPRTVSDLEHRYEVLAGNMTLDLNELLLDENVIVNADIAMGSLDVTVPRGVRVFVTGTAQAGRLRFFQHVEKGVDLQSSVVEGPPNAERTITLDIDAGIASVDVYWGYGSVDRRRGPGG